MDRTQWASCRRRVLGTPRALHLFLQTVLLDKRSYLPVPSYGRRHAYIDTTAQLSPLGIVIASEVFVTVFAPHQKVDVFVAVFAPHQKVAWV